jgi:hypothetical protein
VRADGKKQPPQKVGKYRQGRQAWRKLTFKNDKQPKRRKRSKQQQKNRETVKEL